MVMSPANAQTLPVGSRDGVFIHRVFRVSTSTELVRRLLSPLTALRASQEAARVGKTLRGQPINLASESFFNLCACSFATAWLFTAGVRAAVAQSRGAIPMDTCPGSSRHDSCHSGKLSNDASTVDRREPLALLAAQNVMAQYPVDPQRVYIGGFSGGSRVALRLALGYPDVFHGALLNAGSDPIGNADVSLPAGGSLPPVSRVDASRVRDR